MSARSRRVGLALRWTASIRALGLAGSNVVLSGNEFSFEIPLVHGSYRGTVGADAKTIEGIWGQGTSTPLDFTRKT
jgi:D-alanyl-D-alanine-carboxypeptidase/D-alanyl-D-alanine-endopeptidase